MAQPLFVCIALDENSNSSHGTHARQLQGYLMPLWALALMCTYPHTYAYTYAKYKESVKTKRLRDTIMRISSYSKMKPGIYCSWRVGKWT